VYILNFFESYFLFSILFAKLIHFDRTASIQQNLYIKYIVFESLLLITSIIINIMNINTLPAAHNSYTCGDNKSRMKS